MEVLEWRVVLRIEMKSGGGGVLLLCGVSFIRSFGSPIIQDDEDMPKVVHSASATPPPHAKASRSASLGDADEQLHVQHDHGTGGHWCAKIIFFTLMAILIGLVGLIVLENRGNSDGKPANTQESEFTPNLHDDDDDVVVRLVDTPLSESRFADYLEGWVDEVRPDDHHDDEPHGELDELHELDDHEHDDEPFSEEEVADEDEDDHDDGDDHDGEHDDEDEHDDDDEHEEETEEADVEEDVEEHDNAEEADDAGAADDNDEAEVDGADASDEAEAEEDVAASEADNEEADDDSKDDADDSTADVDATAEESNDVADDADDDEADDETTAEAANADESNGADSGEAADNDNDSDPFDEVRIECFFRNCACGFGYVWFFLCILLAFFFTKRVLTIYTVTTPKTARR